MRPSKRLGFADHPDRDLYLDWVIEALGGEAVDYAGARKCCGFPVITMARATSLRQAGRHLADAIDAGADALVTPCPLCHLNLDLQQPAAAKFVERDLDIPVLHLPAGGGPGAWARAEGARDDKARGFHSGRAAEGRGAGGGLNAKKPTILVGFSLGVPHSAHELSSCRRVPSGGRSDATPSV